MSEMGRFENSGSMCAGDAGGSRPSDVRVSKCDQNGCADREQEWVVLPSSVAEDDSVRAAGTVVATSAGATISVRCDRPSTVAVQPGSNDALSTTTPARRIRTRAATSPCCSLSDSAKTVPAGVAGDGCGSRGSGPAGCPYATRR